jgi:hypothetical protein
MTTNADFAEIDYKRASIFSSKRQFLKKYLVNFGFNVLFKVYQNGAE